MPIIAAVLGLCLGAGMGLIALSELMIAADEARFELVEERIGHPGATELVPIVGAAWAKVDIPRGELIDAPLGERIRPVVIVLPVTGTI